MVKNEMTKQYFIQLADYNAWANGMICSWLDKISDEQWKQPIVSSFKSIEETTVHTIGAEKIWQDRLNLVESPVWFTTVYNGFRKQAIEEWRKSSQGLKSFIENFEDSRLSEILRYVRQQDGKTYELPYYQIFAHAVNHATYHRGQLITMLRQVGFTDVSSMDLSTYFWSKKN